MHKYLNARMNGDPVDYSAFPNGYAPDAVTFGSGNSAVTKTTKPEDSQNDWFAFGGAGVSTSVSEPGMGLPMPAAPATTRFSDHRPVQEKQNK